MALMWRCFWLANKVFVMSIISSRLSRIKPSATNVLTGKVTELKAAGKKIIALNAGEPDFDTPLHIKQAGIKAIQSGETKYTPISGTLALREAITAKFERENSLTYDPMKQVTVGCGGKQVIFNAMMATLEIGDEVIIPAPFWVSYPDIVLLADGNPVFVECPSQTGFKMLPEMLEKAITPKTKWIFINSPNNPSGATYTQRELKEISQVLVKYPDIWILTDDIYEKIIYDDFQFSTIAQIEPSLYDRTLTLNGVSKAYSMTGWRLGYAAGPVDLISAINNIQSQSTTHTSSITQAATIEALNGQHDFVEENNDQFKQRRDLVVSMLNETEGVSCLTPRGAFYVYPSCAGVIGRKTPRGEIISDDTSFCTYLLETQQVAVVPGTAFGMSPFFRISYATSEWELEDACKRIQHACRTIQ